MQGSGSHSWTPLNAALWSGVYQFLLPLSSQLKKNIYNSISNNSLGSVSIVMALLKNGADVDLAMKNDMMTLHTGIVKSVEIIVIFM